MAQRELASFDQMLLPFSTFGLLFSLEGFSPPLRLFPLSFPAFAQGRLLSYALGSRVGPYQLLQGK